MMRRRDVLRGLGLLAAFPALSLGWAAAPPAVAGAAPSEKMVDHLPAIPVLMFHKVNDNPQYPEDIATGQLTALFAHAWKLGYRPVNMSDILKGEVDNVVPKGLKPLGITADDAHPSIIFSRATSQSPGLHNARSFVEVLGDSVQAVQASPRATFFISGVGDDRASKTVGGYFGNILPLKDIGDALQVMPGLELGYHTRTHTRMGGMGPAQVRALLEDQMEHLHKLGMLERVQRILAYPYGVRPSEEGIFALRELGFMGAVLAFPGVREGRYTEVPSCVYDGKLMTDPFLIPRVCIGAKAYAWKQAATAGQFTPIDPIDDFGKDVEKAVPRPYVSRGPAAQPQE